MHKYVKLFILNGTFSGVVTGCVSLCLIIVFRIAKGRTSWSTNHRNRMNRPRQEEHVTAVVSERV